MTNATSPTNLTRIYLDSFSEKLGRHVANALKSNILNTMKASKIGLWSDDAPTQHMDQDEFEKHEERYERGTPLASGIIRKAQLKAIGYVGFYEPMGEKESALVDECSADPYGLEPRYIYADWLDEHGNSETAERVRSDAFLRQYSVDWAARHHNYPSGVNWNRQYTSLLELKTSGGDRVTLVDVDDKHSIIESLLRKLFENPRGWDRAVIEHFEIAAQVKIGQLIGASHKWTANMPEPQYHADQGMSGSEAGQQSSSLQTDQ